MQLNLAKLFTGFTCGVEFWSFLENAAQLSEAPLFRWLRRYAKRRVESHLHIKDDDYGTGTSITAIRETSASRGSATGARSAPRTNPDFKEFETLAWGYRAIFVLLDTYRVRYGLDTIRGMISRWAPPSENHTGLYIRAVAADTGIDPR